MTQTTSRDIPVDDLHLDRENPRLPESLRGKEESTILEHLWFQEVLIELVQSMLTNGFFRQEPLLVQQLEARKWLNWLVDEGRLTKSGKTTAQRFRLPKS